MLFKGKSRFSLLGLAFVGIIFAIESHAQRNNPFSPIDGRVLETQSAKLDLSILLAQANTGTQPEQNPTESTETNSTPLPEGAVRIVYPDEEKAVPPVSYTILDEIVSRLNADNSLRLQVKCYARGEEGTESKSRRLSLIRCLAIRQYFMKKEILSSRMDLRALGFRSEGEPVDRVDIEVLPEGQ